METCYKALYRGGEAELVEKKSRFIATTFPVNSEEEAISFLEAVRKKYWDATHNCSAYVIGRNQELQRCSDDGEPNGTAGRPMLEVLLGEGIHNMAVVVTRYFGGTLLGTGGLVRAYSGAVKAGLRNSVLVEKRLGIRLQVDTDYSGIGKIQYIAGKDGVLILHSEYSDMVRVELLIPLGEERAIQKKINEATNGKAGFTVLSRTWFGEAEGEVLLFEEEKC